VRPANVIAVNFALKPKSKLTLRRFLSRLPKAAGSPAHIPLDVRPCSPTISSASARWRAAYKCKCYRISQPSHPGTPVRRHLRGTTPSVSIRQHCAAVSDAETVLWIYEANSGQGDTNRRGNLPPMITPIVTHDDHSPLPDGNDASARQSGIEQHDTRWITHHQNGRSLQCIDHGGGGRLPGRECAQQDQRQRIHFVHRTPSPASACAEKYESGRRGTIL
jgi:hypothetical protein